MRASAVSATVPSLGGRCCAVLALAPLRSAPLYTGVLRRHARRRSVPLDGAHQIKLDRAATRRAVERFSAAAVMWAEAASCTSWGLPFRFRTTSST